MLEILYEDPSCLAVLKPAGLSTQAPAGIDSLEVRVRDLLCSGAIEAGTPADEVYLGLPHRLDRPVSGVILFAKTRRAARIISRQFGRRQVRKIYWACAEGTVEPAEGTWTDFIRKVTDQPRAEVVAAGDQNAQEAVLHYRTIKGCTLDSGLPGACLDIELETGRMHQVRIQAARRGHPLLGDAQYGATTPFGPQSTNPRERAIALHARSLTFRHSETKESLTVTAPLPAAWDELRLPAS